MTTAPWKPLTHQIKWPKLFTELGNCLIVKYRTGGYDGRWQWRVTSDNVLTLPPEVYENAIVEKVIPFSDEASLVGARNIHGQCVFYPLTYNLHKNGVLRASIVFPKPDEKKQMQAEFMLSTIMKTLNYVGVMAMECFILNNKLIVNELAPRVHNSGHWTQDGASVSQFELHLRAISDLPMSTPNTPDPAIMINLIGTALNPEWLSLPFFYLHWYEKEVFPKRKVGHLNLCNDNLQTIKASLNKMQTLLPDEYKDTITWLNKKLIFNFSNKRYNSKYKKLSCVEQTNQ